MSLDSDFNIRVKELPIPDEYTVRDGKVYAGDIQVGIVSDRIPGYFLMNVCGASLKVEK